MKEVTRKIGPRSTPPRPSLLMLSHCVPGEDKGNNDRARAWQLLEVFSRSHEIHLGCVADGPVSLRQWRSLHARTRQIVIEPVSQVRRMMFALTKIVSAVRAQSMLTSGMLRQPVAEWSARMSIDNILCTTPTLLDAAAMLQGCTRMIDLTTDMKTNARYLHLCDAVIVRDADAVRDLQLGDHRLIVLPEANTNTTTPTMRLTNVDELAPIAMPMPMNKAA